MEQNIAVVKTGQDTPETPHHGGDEKHLNPEGVPLQAAPPGGQGNPDTSETVGDSRRTPGRGGYFIGSAGTMYGADRRSIGDEVRTSEGVYNGVDTVKGTRPKMVGKMMSFMRLAFQEGRISEELT